MQKKQSQNLPQSNHHQIGSILPQIEHSLRQMQTNLGQIGQRPQQTEPSLRRIQLCVVEASASGSPKAPCHVPQPIDLPSQHLLVPYMCHQIEQNEHLAG